MLAVESVPNPTPDTFRFERGLRPDAPGLSKAHNAPRPGPGGPSLSSAVGASYSRLAFGAGPGRTGGGGPRGEVTEFSKASRRRLLRLLNSINRDESSLPFFVTLTYHKAWPKDRHGRKAHLDAFRKRLERHYGAFAAVWRLEFQRRGAPHYHLLVWLPVVSASAGIGTLRERVAWHWNAVADPENVQHWQAGTSVEVPRSWRGVNSYAAKYMGKLEQLQEGASSVGRFWGVWRRGMLPITYPTHSLTPDTAIRIRRIFRNFSKVRQRSHRGELYGVSCFVGYATTNRLLSWLGIIGSDLV